MHTPELHTVPPEARDDDPPVSALMSHTIVAVTPDTPLHTALRVMAAERVRHLPVLHGTRCTGVLTETDAVRAIAVGAAGGLAGRLARSVVHLSPAHRRSAAARAMADSGTDAVLVTEGERIVGLLTATDLIRSLAAEATSTTRVET